MKSYMKRVKKNDNERRMPEEGYGNCMHGQRIPVRKLQENLSAEVMGMESKEYRKQLKQLIDHHGADETLTICTEECAELIKEITKYKRAKNHKEQIGCRVGLAEEMTDVLICIDMMQLIFDITAEEIEQEKSVKMARNLERIRK